MEPPPSNVQITFSKVKEEPVCIVKCELCWVSYTLFSIVLNGSSKLHCLLEFIKFIFLIFFSKTCLWQYLILFIWQTCYYFDLNSLIIVEEGCIFSSLKTELPFQILHFQIKYILKVCEHFDKFWIPATHQFIR